MCDASKRKAKQKWIIEKPKLDDARRLRGIFLIEPGDEEFKHTMKTARRKLEFRCQQQCLARHQQLAAGKPAAVLGKARANMLVLSMPTKL